MKTYTAEELKTKTNDDLISLNQEYMAQKDDIFEEQIKVKAELNSRAALKNFNAMPDAEKAAIVQHINAGNLSQGARA